MKIHVTQTYTLTTEHEVDLTNIKHEYDIETTIGLLSEHNTHAAIDALRGIKSDKFQVVLAGGNRDRPKYEIK